MLQVVPLKVILSGQKYSGSHALLACIAGLVDNLPDTEFHYVDARSVGNARKQAGVRVVPLLQVVDAYPC